MKGKIFIWPKENDFFKNAIRNGRDDHANSEKSKEIRKFAMTF